MTGQLGLSGVFSLRIQHSQALCGRTMQVGACTLLAGACWGSASNSQTLPGSCFFPWGS